MDIKPRGSTPREEVSQLRIDSVVERLSHSLCAYHSELGLTYKFWVKTLRVPVERSLTLIAQIVHSVEHGSVSIPKGYQCTVPRIDNWDQNRVFLQNSLDAYGYIESVIGNPEQRPKITRLEQVAQRPKANTLVRARSLVRSHIILKTAAYILRRCLPNKSVRVGMLGVLVQPRVKVKLAILSLGKVREIPRETLPCEASDTRFDAKVRDKLFLSGGHNDLEKVYQTAMWALFPTMYLEGLADILQKIDGLVRKYPRLNAIVSETWPSDDLVCFLISVAQDKYGIQHIYNEHNYLEHPWARSMSPTLASLADVFLSHGWSDNEIENLVPVKSGFNFGKEQPRRRAIKIELLYISGSAWTLAPSFSGSYGFAGHGAELHIQQVEEFFRNLCLNRLSELHYKQYPTSRLPKQGIINKEKAISKYLGYCKKLYNEGGDTKKLIANARLTIIDYVSTAYIESLFMNVPTVLFFNKESYKLADKHENFFSKLAQQNIVHYDGESAAKFVSEIAGDPNAWWYSKDVQAARNEFLASNFCAPVGMTQWLLDWLSTNDFKKQNALRGN